MFENLLYLFALLYLDEDARVFAEENLHQILFGYFVERYFQTALGIGKVHFEQRGNHTAGRDVVTGQNQLFLHQLLYGVEGGGKILTVLYRGNLFTYLVERLGKGRTAQLQPVEREVDVVDGAVDAGTQHGRNHFADVRHFGPGRDDDRARRIDLVVAIFLSHREAVLAGGDVDAQRAGKVAASLDGAVEAGILALVFAGPHPVGAQRYAVETLGQRSPHDVGKCFGNREYRTGGRVYQGSLRGMAYRGGDTGAAAGVECNHTAVAQRQLNLALALLAGNLTRYRAVYLVGEPVFAGYGLELEHTLYILVELSLVVSYIFVRLGNRVVGHHRAGCLAEHVVHGQVDGFHPVGLTEYEAVVAGRLAHYVEGGALAVGYLTDAVNIFFVDDDTHALLTLVTYDFLGREGGVAHRELVHVDDTTRLLHKFREGVEVTAGTVVVDGDDGVLVGFRHGTYHVRYTFLHFGVGPLYGIQLDGIGILSRLDRRNGAATHTDAVVVATHHHDLLAGNGGTFQGVAHVGETHTAGQHDYLVEGELLAVLGMLEGEQRAADEGLSEFVTEVRGTVRCLNQNLLGRLVEPGAGSHGPLFPFAALFGAGIGRHVYGSTGNRQAGTATAQTVANLTTRTGSGTVEGLDRGGEVVRLGLERDDGLYVFDFKKVGLLRIHRGKLLDHRAGIESHIVLVGRYQAVGVVLRCLLDELEERALFLLSVDDKHAVEDFVAAVLRVYLRETEHLAVGELAADFTAQLVEVVDFVGAQGQTLLLVVGSQVVDVDDGVGTFVDFENLAVDAVVESLQHLVKLGLVVLDREELLDAGNAGESHVLRNLYRIGTPRGNHLFARSYEPTRQRGLCELLGLSEKPG